ncbi:MAG TPA: nascent polypeptide-associated complex protein [Candidatus Pacearchaeota archaeon]|nr:nascent polypeptide-associated complex protein [Candidatus Pacearchaeota archaeon]HOR52164.1 nascent polypeptide-associated complex protein [Candidatus Pacearchaeota archaeon]HOU79276.1 nascent polypeptide-associated complex protein [Candidatus Pacearchaeota archaeon]HQI57633.1 nascent polypeptide-associated complex protein [Candidatus Pacearchaeota archaeon]HQJ57893.1 nascent polypeptide-associated complex protein [Candidatus Pacearchaeota archaeon]
MFPGVNPRQMQGMLKKMGISQEEIDASRVIIEKTDNSRIIIDNPSVTKIKMQGQETFQIAGDISEESAKEETSEKDIKMIIEKTGVSEEIARETLEKNNGDLAETILELSK